MINGGQAGWERKASWETRGMGGLGGFVLEMARPDNPHTAEYVLECSSVFEIVLFYRIQEKVYIKYIYKYNVNM